MGRLNSITKFLLYQTHVLSLRVPFIFFLSIPGPHIRLMVHGHLLGESFFFFKVCVPSTFALPLTFPYTFFHPSPMMRLPLLPSVFPTYKKMIMLQLDHQCHKSHHMSYQPRRPTMSSFQLQRSPTMCLSHLPWWLNVENTWIANWCAGVMQCLRMWMQM